MRLTQAQILSMSAAQLEEYFRQEARQEIAQKKEDAANAEKFKSIAMPYIQRGVSFDDFAAAEQCPGSFREAYRQIEEKYQRTHTPSPEQTELQKLEEQIAAAMGLNKEDDPQPGQAKPTDEGADYVSAVAWAEQVRRDRERAAALCRLNSFGVTGTA